MSSAPRIYIFEPRQEKFYFATLIVVFAIIISVFLGAMPEPTMANIWVRSVVGLMFFNSTHTILTLIGIAIVPELRNWFKTQMKPKRLLFWGPITIALLAAITFRVTGGGSFPAFAYFCSFLFVLFASLHSIGQTRGLTVLYNLQLRQHQTPEENLVQSKVEKFERKLFQALIFVTVLGALQMALAPTYLSPFHRKILAALAIFIVISIVLNSLRSPQVRRSNKTLFVSSNMIYAISIVAPFVMAVQRALHGLEYIFMTEGMIARSKVRRSALVGVGIVVIVSILATIQLVGTRFRFGEVFMGLSSKEMTILMIVSFLTENIHYYLDATMFRMSDPDVRAHVAPLLVRSFGWFQQKLIFMSLRLKEPPI